MWSISLCSVFLFFSFDPDCEKDTELTLQLSGVKLTSETLKTPLVAIANYVFNGLREESISINHGEVSEGCITILGEKGLSCVSAAT